MVFDTGGSNTKKSFERTLAVIWEGVEGTQEVSSLPGIREKRLARTTTSENAHSNDIAR